MIVHRRFNDSQFTILRLTYYRVAADKHNSLTGGKVYGYNEEGAEYQETVIRDTNMYYGEDEMDYED